MDSYDVTPDGRDGTARAERDADVRADAYEVFVAEAARSRLADRTGAVGLRLRSGTVLDGTLRRSDVAGHLLLVDPSGRDTLLREEGVLLLTGSSAGLRPEPDLPLRSLTSWLREAWLSGITVAVLDVTGEWHRGRLRRVGADHVELERAGEQVTIPLAAVAAWQT